MEEDTSRIELAILARGVSKQYGKDPKVLDNLDLTVVKGTIYGLLGASGCGKTTLLGAVLGTRILQNGSISILGNAPGVVPVKSIGYMPQDIALIDEFTIKRMLHHQGCIFGMSDRQIEERHAIYEKLLDLPPGNKLIANLSGGQKRRVSLAVVLIQDPELLILDEPTVGLDPVLRQNLWDYFIKITREEKKSVILTTHYIEEAKQADRVGMLRNGKILAEGEPQLLMNQYNCDSLEDLFISLSVKQEERLPNISNSQQQNLVISKSDELKILNQKPPKKPLYKKLCFTNRGHAKALMSKNFFRYVGSPSTLILVLLAPIIQIFAVFNAIGRIPPDFKIGIVNQELKEYKNCEDYINDNNTIGGYPVNGTRMCNYKGLGCKFVQQVQSVLKDQIYFESIEEGLEAITHGEIHQIFFFPHNYSEAFTTLNNNKEIPPEDFNFSKIVFYRDETDNPLGLYVEKELYTWYQKFTEELAIDCHWRKDWAKIPMVFNEPVYGKVDPNYADLIAPGTMMLIVMTLVEALAIDTILSERYKGIWERTIISGVRPAEILIYHMINLCFISAVQTLESFLFAHYVYGLECIGSMFNALMLLYFQGLVGIATGVLLSVVTNNETEAMICALGLALPLLVLSGYVWPLQSMPIYLQYISYAMPTTIPIESLYNIIFRGWSFLNYHVYKGYLTSIGYICLFTVICVFRLKFEKK